MDLKNIDGRSLMQNAFGMTQFNTKIKDKVNLA